MNPTEKSNNETRVSGNDEQRTLVTAAIAYGIYTVASFATVLVLWGMAKSHREDLFSEGSPLEIWQLSAMLIGALIAIVAAFRVKESRTLLILLGILCLLASVRELDSDLDRLIPGAGWQLPFLLLLLTALMVAFKNRASLVPQLRGFVLHRSFGTIWGGFMIAIPFAQMVGNGDFLENVFADDYFRGIKRLIEECAEVFGYVIIVCGILDFILTGKAAAQSRS